MDALNRLKTYIADHCIIKWSIENPIYDKAGGKFGWMFDLRPLLLNGPMLQTVASLFWDKLQRLWPFQLAGVELAAVPLIAGILMEGERRGFEVSGLIVRQKRNKHGRTRLVEGTPRADLPVILVDDAVNTGRSINKALLAIKDLGLYAHHVFTIANFNSREGVEWCQNNGLTIHYQVTPQEFGLPFKSAERLRTSYKLVWTFAAPRANYRFAVAKSTPVLYKDNILFGSDSGIFWCLDKNTGRLNWWYRTGDATEKGIVSSPVVVGDRVIFGSYSGSLYCLDAGTGSEMWVVKHCQWIGSSPCYANGYIYVGLEFDSSANKGALAKIDAKNGNVEWQIFTNELLHGSPIYSERHKAIVLGTNDSTVLIIDSDTGAIRRSLGVGGPVKYHCAVYNDLAVFGSFDGKIYVWDFVSDEVKMSIQTDDIVYARPLIVGSRAFIGSADHSFRVIDLDLLIEVKRLDAKEKVHSSPALVGCTVFFGTSGGELIGLNIDSLEITHRYQFPERLTNTPVWDGNKMFVYGYDNRLWAVEL